MGYFYLYLSIFSSVVIANLLKYYEKSGYSSSKTLFLGNYLIACIFSAGMSGFKIEPTGLDLLITSASGLFFLAGFIIFIVNIRENGMAVSTSTFRVSYIIPVALSVFLFKENVNIFNYFGIAAIIISFLILGIKNKNIRIFYLLLLFTAAGIADFFPKLFLFASNSTSGVFLTFTYFFAFIFNLLFIIISKEKFSIKPFLFGFSIGIPNMLTTFFFMKSLNLMKAPIAYPLLASNVVLFTLITDKYLWKSAISKRTFFSIVLVIIGILLLYIKI